MEDLTGKLICILLLAILPLIKVVEKFKDDRL
ncbi:hypothetical protein LCGC14_0570500 [marine sediment metagenome]|uniref:Uncharacterized protein n=1 Tax=marine sediment metagenome TaxID=412755 RepID=A0A0F9USM7_9ZZZZ